MCSSSHRNATWGVSGVLCSHLDGMDDGVSHLCTHDGEGVHTCMMDCDEEERVKGVIDGDLSLIVRNRQTDAVSGEVKWLCALCIPVQLPCTCTPSSDYK